MPVWLLETDIKGSRHTCTAQRTFSAAGTYTAWATWMDTNAVWHDLGDHAPITVTAPPGLVLSSGLSWSPGSGITTGQSVTFTFSARNPSAVRFLASRVIVAVRGPSGQNVDALCAGYMDAWVDPSGTFTCTVQRSFATAGTYTAWATWMDTNAVWHSLTSEVQFAVAAH